MKSNLNVSINLPLTFTTYFLLSFFFDIPRPLQRHKTWIPTALLHIAFRVIVSRELKWSTCEFFCVKITESSRYRISNRAAASCKLNISTETWGGRQVETPQECTTWKLFNLLGGDTCAWRTTYWARALIDHEWRPIRFLLNNIILALRNHTFQLIFSNQF